jgi:tetratricopeptide (TPR) repeat protein
VTSKALIFNNRSRLAEARILLEGAIEYAIANDLGSVAARAMNNLSVVFESQDRYAEAIALSERALEHARRVGDRGWEQALILGDVSAYVLLGRWDDAKMVEADAGALLSGSPYFDNLLIHLTEIHCRRGDVAGARTILEQYSAATSDERQARSSWALHEAMVLRAEGKPRAALESVQLALDAGAELGFAFLTVKLGYVEALEAAFELGDSARVEELLATIESLRPGERAPLLEANAHRFRSKLDGSEDGFKAAAPMFRELSMPFWLGVTLLEHGELLAEQGRGADAGPLLAEARELLERLRAPNWVERVDATLADESPVAAENRS